MWFILKLPTSMLLSPFRRSSGASKLRLKWNLLSNLLWDNTIIRFPRKILQCSQPASGIFFSPAKSCSLNAWGLGVSGILQTRGVEWQLLQIKAGWWPHFEVRVSKIFWKEQISLPKLSHPRWPAQILAQWQCAPSLTGPVRRKEQMFPKDPSPVGMGFTPQAAVTSMSTGTEIASWCSPTHLASGTSAPGRPKYVTRWPSLLYPWSHGPENGLWWEAGKEEKGKKKKELRIGFLNSETSLISSPLM